jgi:hypothetical protein
MDNEPSLRQITAIHEAGHAVMRYLRGLPTTNMHVGNGNGLVEGSGITVRNNEDNLLFILAGPASEVIYMDRLHGNNEVEEYEDIRHLVLSIGMDFKNSISSDFDDASQMLEESELLRIRLPDNWQETRGVFETSLYEVDQALPIWFGRCCKELEQHWKLVESVANAAIEKVNDNDTVVCLSPDDLNAIFDKHEQETIFD